MYNEAQKLEYLYNEDNRYEKTTLEAAKSFFNGSADVELQEGTDLSNFNRQQVVKLLKKYNARTKGYYRAMCNIFSDYYNFCLDKGYIESSNFTNWYDSKLSTKIVEEILPHDLVKDKIMLKEDVINMIDLVPDPTNKLLIYAPFIGINGENHEDLKYLRIDDLNEERKVIQLHSGKVQFIDDLFIELIRKADEATRYYPDGIENLTSHRNEYAKSMYVFKQCISKKEEKINCVITNGIFVFKMKCIRMQVGNKYLSITNLYNNGLVTAIKDYYSEKGISLEDALFQQKNNKLYTYDLETQEVINRFGSKLPVRLLRYNLKDTIEYYV